MNTAIEPFRPVRVPALIELLGAGIACTLKLSNGGQPGDGDTCELMLGNNTAVTVSGRLFGRDRRNRQRDFGTLTVTANGLGSSVFPLPGGAASCERLYLEVVGHGIRLSADARIVPSRRTSGWSVYIAILSLLFVGAIGTESVVILGRPVITSLVVPHVVTPGTITASFATRGRASGTYVATAADGTVLSSGVLPGSGGQLPIPVPAAIVGQRVRVALEMHGPLGHAQRDADFAVVAAPVAAPVAPNPAQASRAVPAATLEGHPANIAYFNAHRERYAGTTSIVASYGASGERGKLRVLDSRGTVLGVRDFSHAGTTRIPLDAEIADQTLLVDLDVVGGGKHAMSAAIIASDVADAESSGAAPTALANGDASTATSSDPFFVEQRVVAGHPFTIEIRHPLPNLRIALQNTSGTPIDEVDVPPSARKVTLIAPASTTPEIYYLAGTFTRSSAEETLVRSLRIYPD